MLLNPIIGLRFDRCKATGYALPFNQLAFCHLRRETTVVRIVSRSRVPRQASIVVGLGLALSAIVAQVARAQSPASFSALTGQPNLTALPGQNLAQQTMSGSINNFCPTVSMTAVTANQTDLKTICSAMIGNAQQLQGVPITTGGSYGLSTTSELTGALQSLNGGAELLVPTNQASVAQTTQTSRQNGAIEQRLKELRD